METINIRLAAFEGPLDLLYHLIEKNEIDIYDIPIAALTEQYLAYLDAAEDRDMDGMSEFLLMAATLLEIKSTKNEFSTSILKNYYNYSHPIVCRTPLLLSFHCSGCPGRLLPHG